MVPEDEFRSQFSRKKSSSPKSKSSRKVVYKQSQLPSTSFLKNRGMDLSTRNQLFNQNLVANLKHKRSAGKRPIPLKLSSMPDDFAYISNDSFLQSRDDEMESIPEEAAYKTHNVDEDDEPIVLDDRHVDMRRRGRFPVRVGSLEAPDRGAADTPRRPPRLRISLDERRKDINKAANTIFRQMLKTPDIYRVTKDGRILRPNRRGPFERSRPNDVVMILRSLLGDDIGGYIPAGYEKFLKDLRGTEIENLLNHHKRVLLARHRIVGGGWVPVKPLKTFVPYKKVVKRTKRSTNRKPKTVRHKLQWPRRK